MTLKKSFSNCHRHHYGPVTVNNLLLRLYRCSISGELQSIHSRINNNHSRWTVRNGSNKIVLPGSKTGSIIVERLRLKKLPLCTFTWIVVTPQSNFNWRKCDILLLYFLILKIKITKLIFQRTIGVRKCFHVRKCTKWTVESEYRQTIQYFNNWGLKIAVDLTVFHKQVQLEPFKWTQISWSKHSRASDCFLRTS